MTTLAIILVIFIPLTALIYYRMGYNKGWNDADQYSKMYKRVHDYIMENYAKERDA